MPKNEQKIDRVILREVPTWKLSIKSANSLCWFLLADTAAVCKKGYRMKGKGFCSMRNVHIPESKKKMSLKMNEDLERQKREKKWNKWKNSVSTNTNEEWFRDSSLGGTIAKNQFFNTEKKKCFNSLTFCKFLSAP